MRSGLPLGLTWESFHEALIEPAIPAVHPIPGVAGACMFVAPAARRIGAWLPASALAEPLPRSGRALLVQRVVRDGVSCVEVSTGTESLFHEVFILCGEVVSRVELGETAEEAVGISIAAWRALMSQRPCLTPNEEVGLWGELWFLSWLLDRGHVAALSAWTGPAGEAHDFRIGRREIEIKTTTGPRRQHRVSSLEQLVPSPGHSLALISLVLALGPAPAGMSLPRVVQGLRERFSAVDRSRFAERLGEIGYEDDDADRYQRSFIMRMEPQFVPVDENCPQLTRRTLSKTSEEAVSRRILAAAYTVDLEGLGEMLERARGVTL